MSQGTPSTNDRNPPAGHCLDRRQFLNAGLRGAAAIAVGAMLPSVLAAAPNAFDLALRGQDLIQKKSFAEAAAVLERAVAMDPASDWAQGLLGRAYFGMGRLPAAVNAFRAALRINPDDTFSRMMIDMITQRPLPAPLPASRGPTKLETAAEIEAENWERRLTDDGGLEYRVSRVVIDAGHGGFDSGAVGARGLQEKAVTLALAQRVYQRLSRQGRVTAFLTRTGDYYLPLSARTVIANQYRADLFLSIHINASTNRSAGGVETFFCAEKASSAEAEKVAAYENEVLRFDAEKSRAPGQIDIEDILFRLEQKNNWRQSGTFADIFQSRMNTALPLRHRGVQSANFFVLRKAKMPSILLETGFISNLEEEALLSRSGFLDSIADAIVKGVA
jgi:N-acetylmuramoyl-L-alanine amidase